MAAPSGTVWGSTVNGKGKIGISFVTSYLNPGTTMNVTISVWFWSKYAVVDDNNTVYFNNNSTSATTSRGSKSIKHSANTGSGWSTSNQTRIFKDTYTMNRKESKRTINCAAKFGGIDWVGGTMSVKTSYSVPALPTYKITYDTNGGSGGPSSENAIYSKNYAIPDIEPKRSGYEFIGWSTGSEQYSPGGSFKVTSAVTLTAVWEKDVFTVKYNSNKGVGSISTQTKNAGKSVTIQSGSQLTREGYTFKNWNTQSNGDGITYNSGDKYSEDENLTLYAQWTPWEHTLNFYLTEEDKSKGNKWGSQTNKTGGIILLNGGKSSPPTMGNLKFKNWKWTPVRPLEDGEEELPVEYYSFAQPYSYTHPIQNGEAILIAQWTDKGILLYKNGDCECLELQEDDGGTVRFYKKDGSICCKEFIEGDNIVIDKKGRMTSIQFIEKDL